MCSVTYLWLPLLFHTVMGTIPSLSDVYCHSDYVVIAVATRADYQANSDKTQMNGTEFRLSRVLKGPLAPGQLIYSIDRQFYRVGSRYVVLLRSATAAERGEHLTRAASFQPYASTPILAEAGPALLVHAGQVQIPTDYIVPGPDLISPEDIFRLRAKQQPFLLRETALESTFGRFVCPPAREDSPSPVLQQRSLDIPYPTGRAELVEASIEPATGTWPAQKLESLCRVDFLYPQPAERARMQGIVVLRGVLSEGGRVHCLWVVRGINPLLDRAALSGISEARFPLPYVPDGAERIFTATVRFSLL